MEQIPGGGGFLKVLFWGTPHFALPSLRALARGGEEVVGVVTQPDRPKGRGRKLSPSPVKAFALEAGIPVLTPDRPRGPEFLDALKALNPDVSVVVAYGHILPLEVLHLPPLQSINVHASLLPELRGAGPVNWAILRGMDVTGVTIMRMVEEMDAGPIILQKPEPIGPGQTASELGERLSGLGARALLEGLDLLESGRAEEVEQDHRAATFAPKVDRNMARVDWKRTAPELDLHLRGFDAVPGAWSVLEGDPVKLYTPEPRPDHPHRALPGTVLEASPERGLLVACGNGALGVGDVQPAGKRRMPVGDWLRGHALTKDVSFE
ncbi:MAG: methionyl-tRNA formyltransferase [Gemmatimonadota bacterium]